MTSPTEPKTRSTESELTYWQRFNRDFRYVRNAVDWDGIPELDLDPTPSSAPAMVREVASVVAEEVFDVRVKQYSPDDFATKSPGAGTMNWKGTSDLTTPVKTVSRDGVKLVELAKELVKRGETAQGSGEVHMLKTDRNEHAYTIVTPFYSFPTSVAQWLATLGNNNPFRMLVGCFPAGGGELPPKASPPQIGIEPVDGGTRTEIEQYRAKMWQNNTPFGGLVPLGLSSMIWARNYTEVYDEPSGLLIRSSMFVTSRYHVLDGLLTWMLIVDTRNNRTMYAAVGAGYHPLRYIDQINPIAGGIVMAVMMRSFVRALHAGQEGPNKMLTNGPGFRTLNDYIHQVDPGLSVQRRLLKLADRAGIPASEGRRAHGGNVVDDE